MKKVLKQLHIVCTVVLLCLSLCAQLSAAECGLQITLLDEKSAPIAGITVEICLVATGEGEHAALTAEFAAAGVDASTLLADNGADVAETLYQYLLQKGIAGQAAVTDAAGKVDLAAADAGVYLVFERGGQPFTFLPYLVRLADGEVTKSEPKVEESQDKSLTVSKVWDDDANADGIRPGMIEVTLFRDGKAIRKASLSAANGWKHTFTKLPNSGTYTVEETAVSGYTPTYTATGDGFVITNFHESDTDTETIEVTVKKVWDDADDRAGKRPRSITVQLVQDGKIVQTAVLSADNDWTTSFSGLDAASTYSVREIAVSGYKASYSGSAAHGFVITNKYAAPTDPTVTNEPITTDTPDPTVTTAPADPTVTTAPREPSETAEPPVTTEPEPVQPEDPDIPQTGANRYPVYVLFAAGALLVLLGVADLLHKRVKK